MFESTESYLQTKLLPKINNGSLLLFCKELVFDKWKADVTRESIVPAPGEGKRGAEGHLGYLMRQPHAAVREAMAKALADRDLTPPQFAVLTMVVN